MTPLRRLHGAPPSMAAAATTAALLLATTSHLVHMAQAAVEWCSDTKTVVLTTCGDLCKPDVEQPCVQYPSGAPVACDTSTGNECVAHDDDEDCTYQCVAVFNPTSAKKWTLFVKEPTANDIYPVAPITEITNYQIPGEAQNIQITGFDTTNVQKGSMKSVELGQDLFANTKNVKSLALSNLELSGIRTGILPSSTSELLMENCNLSTVPQEIWSMNNLNSLRLAKNGLSSLTNGGNSAIDVLKDLTYLDLSNNELTTFQESLPKVVTLDLSNNNLAMFPDVIFAMRELKTLQLSGNSIENTTFTQAQFNFLKKLSSESTLGISSVTSACDVGIEDTVLGATVCVTTLEDTAPADDGGSSSVLLIVVIVLAVLVVLGGIAFFVYRRRTKTNSEFFVRVMEGEQNRTGDSSGTGASRPSSLVRGARAGSTPGGRPSRGGSVGRPSTNMGSRGSIPKIPSVGNYSDLGLGVGSLSRGSGPSGLSIRASHGDSSQLSQPTAHRRDRAQINSSVVHIDSEDLIFTRSMARGAFGEVYLARYGQELVAVKKLLAATEANVGAFIGELNLLANLSHPRILTLVGACWDENNMTKMQFATEYMDSGDLLTVLRGTPPDTLTWAKGKSAYCLHICEAVYYLHSLQPALIHRDIKSRNILVDSRKGAKLSDFGESRERTIQSTMTGNVGTARWVAPEIILGEDYSELADIYSLGVLLTELDTHRIPFEGMGLDEAMIVQQVAVGKLRPQVSSTCPEVIQRLTHECLQFDPLLRPPAARVLQVLMESPLMRRLSTISDTE